MNMTCHIVMKTMAIQWAIVKLLDRCCTCIHMDPALLLINNNNDMYASV